MMRCYGRKVFFASLAACAGIMLLMTPVLAADDNDDAGEAIIDEAQQEKAVKDIHYAQAATGYRFITPRGATAAAEPYSLLKSGVTGSFSAGTLGPDLKLTGETNILSEDDYHAELFFDYGGYFRMHLESEALWHNLLTEQLPGTAPGQYTTRQSDSRYNYGVRTGNSQMESRIKLGNNPVHLNLGYWELRREGMEQLRFTDHAFPNAATNTIISDGRRVDGVTREGRAGFDAHLGYFDIAYDFRIRDFVNDAPDYRYPFTVNVGAGLPLTAGSQATNVVSGSRVMSHTVKLYTDMSGGLVGSGVYSLTQRENMVDHGDARPSSRPNDTMHSVAADLSYTPYKLHSFAIKYRHQQIDREAPGTVYYPFSQIPTVPTGVYTATPGVLLVRPPIETVKDLLSLSTTIRPTKKITYRMEYQVTMESRNNVPNSGALPSDPTAIHSERLMTNTGTVNVAWKPYAGTRLNIGYVYRTTDNPALPNDATESHRGELFMTYAKNGTWGTTTSFITRYETSERGSTTLAPAVNMNLPREYRNNSANASIWFSPLQHLTVTGNYSFLQTDADQSMLFANVSPGFLVATNYRSTAHVYGLNAVYAMSEAMDLSLGFQQVFSESRFNVPPGISFINAGVTYSTAGITELTRANTIETSVNTRADWRFSKHVGCALDYGFRQYDSGNSLYDGSVHTTILSLTARW